MQQIRQFVQGGQAPISEVLQAVRMWRESNMQVVKSVVDYNRSIAAYSLNVMGGNKSPDQMALALVGKPKTQATEQPVRQATLPAEFQQGRNIRLPGEQPINNQRTLPPSNFSQESPLHLNRGNFNSGNQQFRNPNPGGIFRGN